MNHQTTNNSASDSQPGRQQQRRKSRNQGGNLGSLLNSFTIFEGIKSNSAECITEVDTRNAHAIKSTVTKILLKGVGEEDEELTVDLSEVTTKEDLKALRATDPFLYYSIPKNHLDSYSFNDLADSEDDENEIGGASPAGFPSIPLAQRAPVVRSQGQQTQDGQATQTRRRSSSSARNLSCPAGMLANADISYSLFNGGTTIVTRSHRLSTEAHPSLMMDDLDLSSSDDDDDDQPARRVMAMMNDFTSTRRFDERE